MLFQEFHISLQSTGGYSLWLNGEAERHIQTISNMMRSGFIDSGLPKILWCYNAEYQVNLYNALLHSATNEQPDYEWFGIRRSIHDIRVWGCEIRPISQSPSKLQSSTQHGYFMGVTNTQAVIKWWDPNHPTTIKYCTSAKFNEFITYLPDGKLSPGSMLMQNTRPDKSYATHNIINLQKHPILQHSHCRCKNKKSMDILYTK